MNSKKNPKSKKPKKTTDDFGADPDEQAMNGLYGPLETEYEDRLHNLEK